MVIVLTPPDLGLMVAIPTTNLLDCRTLALKVLTPVIPSAKSNVLEDPKTDFTLEILFSVIAIAILPFSSPLKESLSFAIKVPLLLYTVTAVPALTGYLMNPVAPLELPLTKVGNG